MTGETKFNFERIPVETVRRIAKDLPVQSVPAIRGPGHSREESQNGKDWQELALQVQQENNPKKMIHLVDQLIDALDRNKRRSDPLTSAAQNPVAAIDNETRSLRVENDSSHK